MLLAIDIGNTNIKFGVYDGSLLTFKLSLPTIKDLTAAGLSAVAGAKLPTPIASAMVSSVVPEVNGAVGEFVRATYGITATFVSNDLDFALTLNYQPLSDLGTDRIVNVYSAVQKYGAPIIVCSFGTAMTVDVVNADSILLGGVIAPGMTTLAHAIHINTAKLPEVVIEKPAGVLQNTTVAAIQSGLVYGYIGLVRELLQRIKAETAIDARVIATGGSAAMIAENTDTIDVVDNDLLLDGLNMLFARLHQQQ